MALNPARTPDAVFYGDSATDTESELATDDSQEAINLTSGGAGAGFIYDGGTNRFRPAVYTEFTVTVGVTMSNATVGTFWAYGNGWTEVKISGGVITVHWNNADLFTHTLVNISASTETFEVVLAVEPNTALTTGASNAYRCELHVFNVTQGTTEIKAATMAVDSSIANDDSVFGARTSGGTNVFGGTLRNCAFYRSFHTSVWGWENFVVETAAPTLAGDESLEVHVPARNTGIGDDGQLAGPVLLLGAAQANQSDLRLVSPLVNDWFLDPPALSLPISDNSPWHVADPDDANRLLYKAYLYRRPVPPTVNKAKCRLFFQMYRTDGAANDTLEVSVFCMNWPGPLYKPPWSPPTFEKYRVSKSYTTSHGSGALDGVWCDFDDSLLTLARDSHDYTYLCLAFKVTDAGGAATPENQLFKFQALIVEPVYLLAENGLNLGGG